eukprot:gene18738-20627_t
MTRVTHRNHLSDHMTECSSMIGGNRHHGMLKTITWFASMGAEWQDASELKSRLNETEATEDIKISKGGKEGFAPSLKKASFNFKNCGDFYSTIKDKLGTMKWFLISLYFISSVLKVAEGGGQLSLNFINFENPGHRLANRHCCNALCLNKCDVFFRICLSLKSQSPCSLMFIETPVLGKDLFTFGTSLGNGQSNPLLYSFDQWTEPFIVSIRAMDHGGSNRRPDLISMNSFRTAYQPDKDSVSATAQATTLRGYRSVLKLSHKIYCDAGYFKPSCNESCRATNDSSGHYTCDFDKAERVCMKNWYGPRCTTYCQARNDNTRGHYRCDSGSGAKKKNFTAFTTLGPSSNSVYATSSRIELPSKVLHSKVMSQATNSNASNSNSNIQKPNLRTLIYIGVPILFVIVALLLILAGREIYRSHMKRSSKEKKFKLEDEFTRPLMMDYLKSTKIGASEESFQVFLTTPDDES